jgi:hypothetical protein
MGCDFSAPLSDIANVTSTSVLCEHSINGLAEYIKHKRPNILWLRSFIHISYHSKLHGTYTVKNRIFLAERESVSVAAFLIFVRLEPDFIDSWKNITYLIPKLYSTSLFFDRTPSRSILSQSRCTQATTCRQKLTFLSDFSRPKSK